VSVGMLMGNRKAVAPVMALALAGLVAAGCGGSSDDPPAPKPPPVSAATASHLAELSDRIATDLDAGETCSAAYDADQLKEAVGAADLAASLRPGVEQVASSLVDEVNCPPPPPEPKEKEKKKEDKHGDENENGGIVIPPPPGHGGEPPGHAKIHGEDG
jgi:hypothetical protein